MTVSVSTVDAIGEKTRLQAKAAFFPAEMLFFHGSALAEKNERAARGSSRCHMCSVLIGINHCKPSWTAGGWAASSRCGWFSGARHHGWSRAALPCALDLRQLSRGRRVCRVRAATSCWWDGARRSVQGLSAPFPRLDAQAGGSAGRPFHAC